MVSQQLQILRYLIGIKIQQLSIYYEQRSNFNAKRSFVSHYCYEYVIIKN